MSETEIAPHAMPCERCGELVTIHAATGPIAEAWASGLLVTWCEDCYPYDRGEGS